MITLNSSFDIKLQDGRNHLEIGDPDMALEIFLALEREGYATPDLLEGIGRSFMVKGSTEQAIAYFQKAIGANPNLLISRINLGICMIDHGKVAEAVDILKVALQTGQSSGGMTPNTRVRLVKEHVRVAETYVELGLSMEAVQEFEKAIRIGGDYPDIRRKIAREYIRMNLLADAERELKKALHRNPFYEEARADLGYLYLLKGHVEQANQEWSQIDPEGRGGGLVSAYRGDEGESGDRSRDRVPDVQAQLSSEEGVIR